METVTRRQQLEYLVEKCNTWPSTASCIEMSTETLGALVSKTDTATYTIYQEEYIEEKNKRKTSSVCKTVVMSLDEAIAHAKEKATELGGNCGENHAQLAKWLEEYKKLKPKTIMVNGFEVPEPLSLISKGETYSIPAIDSEYLCSTTNWYDGPGDIMFMERGMCHSTPEAAIAHAKAMLGIAPSKEDI